MILLRVKFGLRLLQERNRVLRALARFLRQQTGPSLIDQQNSEITGLTRAGMRVRSQIRKHLRGFLGTTDFPKDASEELLGFPL